MEKILIKIYKMALLFIYGHKLIHGTILKQYNNEYPTGPKQEITADLGRATLSYLTKYNYLTKQNVNIIQLIAAIWLSRPKKGVSTHPYNEERAACLFELAAKTKAAFAQLNIE